MKPSRPAFSLLALVAGFCIILAAPKSFAIAEVSLLFGNSYSTPFYSADGFSTTTTSQTFSSYGALANLRFMGDTSSLSTGLLYMQMGGRIAASTAGESFDKVLNIPYFVLPLIYDFWFIPHYFDVGAGFYYGFPAGNVVQTGSLNTGGTVTSLNKTSSFGDNSVKTDDYGLILHLQVNVPLPVNIPFADLLYATVQGMYMYGLEDVNTGSNPAALQHNTSLVVLLGAGLGF